MIIYCKQYMDYSKFLNEKQLEAVTTRSQYARVVAGAGSGKTRVLTYRIAYLISELNYYPWNILAITFTNKVANEMMDRVIALVPESQKDLTIKTFHSFAAMFLRREINVIGFPSSFTILDEEDQTKLVKDIAAELGFRKSDKIVSRALNYIGYCKLKGKYPDDIHIEKPIFEDEKTCLDIYTRYEDEKDKTLSLDFDDLLLKTNYILENYPDIRAKWQTRFEHILIDEFQDTNDIEYKMVRLLMKPSTHLYVVGDPDQTIYTWRGANQKIILSLEKDFLDMETIILARNYRSTQNILNSANKLIANNKLRVKKDLFTENDKGNPIVVRSSPNSKSEADYVSREVKKLIQTEGYHYSDIAILYRSNYVTVDFETSLTANGIPYKIFGGTKFYQRKEIKDVLAYFHLITNTRDDISFERIINVPRRGVGDTTINILRQEARENNSSLYDYCQNVDYDNSNISSKCLNSIKTMITLIDTVRDELAKNEEVFSKVLEDMVWSLGFREYLLKDDDGDERLENVKALFEDIRHFLKAHPDSTFDEYLQNISLLSAQDDIVDGDFLNMMTVHTAKGLEFPVVFVVRLNDGVFPHNRALLENGFAALEEERRLAYVAFTRAKKLLYLTFSSDYSYVLNGQLRPSQFLKESGNCVANEDSYNPYRSLRREKAFNFDDGPNSGFTSQNQHTPIRQDFSSATNGLDESDWKVGDIVIHKTLGKGKVIELEGDNIIKVNFDEHGIKSIMGNHPFVSKGGYDA